MAEELPRNNILSPSGDAIQGILFTKTSLTKRLVKKLSYRLLIRKYCSKNIVMKFN